MTSVVPSTGGDTSVGASSRTFQASYQASNVRLSTLTTAARFRLRLRAASVFDRGSIATR